MKTIEKNIFNNNIEFKKNNEIYTIDFDYIRNLVEEEVISSIEDLENIISEDFSFLEKEEVQDLSNAVRTATNIL